MKRLSEKLVKQLREQELKMRNFRHIVRMSKSQKGLFAQLIGENGSAVIGKRYDFSADKKTPPIVQSVGFGKDFATLVAQKKVKEITFDRNSNIYHGRIKAFAEGMREQGLIF
jgi:large subunit ribosomal protein L18